MIMVDKCISPVKIEGLSANKKILRQLPRQSEISKEVYNSKMLSYEKVLLEKIKIKDCTRATEEHKERIAEQPREWIKPLFDREIISLKTGIKTRKWWV